MTEKILWATDEQVKSEADVKWHLEHCLRKRVTLLWWKVVEIDNNRIPSLKKIKVGFEENEVATKPPLGLRPEEVVRELRIQEIKEAIIRYIGEGCQIPMGWIDEYNILVSRAKSRTSAET